VKELSRNVMTKNSNRTLMEEIFNKALEEVHGAEVFVL
jgi:hypothetical protein